MSLLDHIIGLLAPHCCVGCGYEGALLCRRCAAGVVAAPARCYRCHEPSRASRTCQACLGSSSLRSVRVAVVYEGAAKDIVWRLKFEGAQAAATEMARLMVPLLPTVEAAHVVPVPTATGRARRRGYDQARLLARAVAKQGRLPYLDCLRRHGQAHQVGAGRQQRLHQLQSAFRPAYKLSGIGPVILIDDVITTGATLEAAAAALTAAGARHVEAMAFAQPRNLGIN